MKLTKKKLLCAVLALCMAVALCACSTDGKNQTEEPSYVTIIGENDPMLYWDPAESWAAEIRVLVNIYDTLVRLDADGETFKPNLAESWTTSEDGLTWSFKIREGVKFHSGAPLTAQTCADSLNRTISMGKSATFMWNGVTSITAPDDTTLVIECDRPMAMLYIVSASYTAYIYNPEHDSEWYKACQCDGTGPYMLESYTQNSEVVLKKFDDYWGGWEGEHVDFCIYKTVFESATARQMMLAGEGDLWLNCPYDYINDMAKDENIKISDVVSYQTLYAYLNCQKEPLSDVRVRQALSYLTPYQDIIDQVVCGHGTQCWGILPPTIWGYSEDVMKYEYDFEKGVALLKEAGYENGFTINYVYNTGDANLQKVGELLKDAFAKANVTLELQAMTSDAKYALARGEDPKQRQDIVMIYWWPDYVDPSSYFYSMFYSEEEIGFNLSYYYNPVVDELIDKAYYATGESIEQATKYYAEAADIIMKDAAVLSLYSENYTKPVAKKLMGFVDNVAYPTAVFCYDLYKTTE